MSGTIVMLLLLAAPDVAPSDAAAPVASSAARPQDGKRQICRVSTTTGSRLIQKKTCGTKSDWALINRESKDNLDKSVIGGAYCNPEGAPC